MTLKQLNLLAGIVIVLGLIAWGVSLIPLGGQHILSGGTDGEAYTHAEGGTYYDISVKLPAHTPLIGAADAKARLAMEQAFAQDIAQFKKDSGAGNVNLADEPRMEGRKYQYAATYAGVHLAAFYVLPLRHL